MANVLIHLPPDRLVLRCALPRRPAEGTGRLTDYRLRARISKGPAATGLEGARLPPFSDLIRDYPDPPLLHDIWGGGAASGNFLPWVTLEPGFAREIAVNIHALKSGYAAIHVRLTDFRTEDWRSFLKSTRGGSKNCTVLICCDNAAVIEGARSILKEARVRTLTEISKHEGQPLPT